MNEYKGKSILIMGATSQTVPFITKAHEMGVKVYCADNSTTAIAKRYADYPLLIDCFDIDQLEIVVNEKSIDGIVLGCADVLLSPYEELCHRTGKPCYATREQVDTFGNKKGLKIKLKEYGLPYIPEFKVSGEDTSIIKDEQFPIFVKPVDNCSSKGMSVCFKREDFSESVKKALDASRSKTILVERYMLCDDISITYTFADGNIFVTSISDRYVNREQKGVGTITTALVYPSKYTKLYFDTIHEKACNMFRALGIKNGVLTMQSFVENGQIMFYDPAFRTTGGQGYILYNYFGAVDQIRMLIEFALTGKMTNDIGKISTSCNFGSAWAVNLVVLIKTGTIKSIKGIEEAKRVPGVINVTQSHFEGDTVTGRGTLDQTLARLHIVADTKEELSQAIDSVIRGVRVFDTEDNDMLLTQFDTKDLQKYYV